MALPETTQIVHELQCGGNLHQRVEYDFAISGFLTRRPDVWYCPKCHKAFVEDE